MKQENLLLECIVGSQSYGLNHADSDIDKKFIFIDSLDSVLTNTENSQINIDKNYTGYEIGRFCELLAKSNPNIIELLNPPEDTILHLNPLYKKYFIDNRKNFITKKIIKTFGEYANTQIKKAQGLNKKIMKPVEEGKTLLDFCFVQNKNQASMPLKTYLLLNQIDPEACGVSALNHMKNCFLLFVDKNYNIFLNSIKEDPNCINDIFCAKPSYKGIIGKNGHQLLLSSIEKSKKSEILFYANIEGYSTYCKDLSSYKTWLKERNEARYKKNMEVGKEYDCYVDEETEFLTINGWKKFDEVSNFDLLASINNEKELIFLPIKKRHENLYTGDIYSYESRYTRFSVSENHNLFLATYNRSKGKFDKNTTLKNLIFNFEKANSIKNSKFNKIHISNLYNTSVIEGSLNLTNDELFILGAFISDGTICFNKKKEPRRIVIQQKKNSLLALRLESLCNYKYESTPDYPGFVFNELKLVEWIYENIGHGTFIKRIPLNLFTLLTKNEFDFFLDGLILGDGYFNKNGSKEYKSSNKNLIDSVQILCLMNGYNTQIYTINDKKREVKTTYSLYISKKRDKFFKMSKKSNRPNSGWKINKVENKRIVCFTVSTNILITRNKNKIAIQGNTKNMSHCFRLLNLCSRILQTNEINIRCSPTEITELINIKNGSKEYVELLGEAQVKIKEIQKLAAKSNLKEDLEPNYINELLLNLRKEFYNLNF